MTAGDPQGPRLNVYVYADADLAAAEAAAMALADRLGLSSADVADLDTVARIFHCSRDAGEWGHRRSVAVNANECARLVAWLEGARDHGGDPGWPPVPAVPVVLDPAFPDDVPPDLRVLRADDRERVLAGLGLLAAAVGAHAPVGAQEERDRLFWLVDALTSAALVAVFLRLPGRGEGTRDNGGDQPVVGPPTAPGSSPVAPSLPRAPGDACPPGDPIGSSPVAPSLPRAPGDACPPGDPIGSLPSAPGDACPPGDPIVLDLKGRPGSPVSLNEARGRHFRAHLADLEAWRDDTAWSASALGRAARARGPVPVTVQVVVPFLTNRRRDPANYALLSKACVDGLVIAGLVPDDDAAWVTVLDPELVVTGPDRRRLRALVRVWPR